MISTKLTAALLLLAIVFVLHILYTRRTLVYRLVLIGIYTEAALQQLYYSFVAGCLHFRRNYRRQVCEVRIWVQPHPVSHRRPKAVLALHQRSKTGER